MGWDCCVIGGMAGRRREMWDLTWDPVWDNTGKDNLGTCAGVGSPSPAYIQLRGQKLGLENRPTEEARSWSPYCLIN